MTPNNPWGDAPTSPPPRNQEQKSGNTIDDLVDHIHRKFKKKGGGSDGGPNFPIPPFSKKSGRLPVFLALLFIGFWLCEGFFRVQEGEVGVILRFGKVHRISSPGLNFRWPYPFEREIIRKVSVYNKIDSLALRESEKTMSEESSLLLTGDENMVHIDYTVLWKIKDVIDFLFTTRTPETTIRIVVESVIREVLGQTTAKLALTEGREVIGANAQELLQKLLDTYKMGVQIVSVQLQRVEAPSQVIAAFNEMQASLTDADRLKNEASAYAKDVIPRARGEAEKIVQEAEAYAKQIVAEAEGETARFLSVLEAYKKDPDVVRTRMFIETAEKILQSSNKTIVDKKLSIMPWMNIKEPPTPYSSKHKEAS